MLVIRDTSSVPSERWHFPVPETGFDVFAPNYAALYGMVVQHCQANQVPVPSEQDVVDWLCANVSIPCYESETRVPLINRFSLGIPAKPTACCGQAKK